MQDSAEIRTERQRCVDIVKKHSSGLHCCLLADDGSVEEQYACTCWRSKIVMEIENVQMSSKPKNNP